MKTRTLGTPGLVVSQVGLGCMGLTGSYDSNPDEKDALEVLDRAVELGVTFFDTAEVYGPFTNELLVGKGLSRHRDKVIIASKFGFLIPPEGGYPQGVDSRPENIRRVCDTSLKRLGIDTIDVFYQHRVDPGIPIEDVAGTVSELVSAGKVRFFGMSEAGSDTIRRAHAVHPVSVLQSEYSLWSREIEREILPTCRELGIGLVPYSPLGRGFLAGAGLTLAATDMRRSMPRWKDDALAANLGLVETLVQIAQSKSCSPAQLALAWLLSQGDDIVPIPGTTKLHRLEENCAAVDVHLSVEDKRAIEDAIPESAVKGGRYNEAQMNLIES